MKRGLIFIAGTVLLLGLIALSPREHQKVHNLNDLEWILHTWQRVNVRPGTTAFETWYKESDQLFTGIGVSLKGSDTTFVEKLRIEVKDNKVYYVADVKENATPTYFLMSDISNKGFKSANPEHDFPKAIDYSMEGSEMTVIISDGADKKIGFQFKKIN